MHAAFENRDDVFDFVMMRIANAAGAPPNHGDDAYWLNGEAGFLQYLANDGLTRGLSRLDRTGWKAPRVVVLLQQNSPA